MDKNKILDIKNKLEEASNIYYNTDNKIMSDEEFDKLKDLYEEESGLKFDVGAKPLAGNKGIINIEHTYPELVGTLDKVNTVNEFMEWISSKLKDLKHKEHSNVMVSRKFDGNSVTIIYNEQGHVTKALTRGRDGKGMDLYSIFKDDQIKNTQNTEIAIRYEAILKYSKFEKYMEDQGVSYANPRSVISGILGRDDGYKYRDYIDLIPLDCIVKGKDNDRQTQLLNIKQMCNDDITIADGSVIIDMKNINDIEDIYKSYSLKFRESLDYMIDGLVIEILDTDIREELGRNNNRPNYSIALKFPYMEKSTKVDRIEFDFGLTGQITPVVCYEPVEFNGAVQKRTSLANYKRFKELKLGKGSDILVQYRNEVLSYVEKLETDYNKEVTPIPFIENCPICNEKIDIVKNDKGEETLAFCVNADCPGIVSGRISRYIKTLDIKGVADKSIERMIKNKTISTISDLYDLDHTNIEYFGPTQSKNIINAIRNKSKVYDYEVLAGLGMKDISKSTSKVISKVWSIDELFVKLTEGDFESQLSSLEGIGPITSKVIVESLEENSKLYEDLKNLNEKLDLIKYKNEFNKDEYIYTICVTGNLKYHKRDVLKNILEKRGHKLTGSVTSKTDYLVNNNSNSNSSKNKKAKDLGISIISEDELYDKLKLEKS